MLYMNGVFIGRVLHGLCDVVVNDLFVGLLVTNTAKMKFVYYMTRLNRERVTVYVFQVHGDRVYKRVRNSYIVEVLKNYTSVDGW